MRQTRIENVNRAKRRRDTVKLYQSTINQLINQSKHICIPSYVANESEAHNGSFFKLRLKVLRSSADLQLYDGEFQAEGALTLNAFADIASPIRGTASNNLSDDRSVRAGR